MAIDLRARFQELQTLDVQNPGAWPDWVRGFTAVLLVIAIIGGSYWFLIKDQYERAARAAQTEQELRASFEKKQRRAAALDDYRARLKVMEREFGQMLRQLPGRAEVANLLNDISQTRSANNLEEEIFEPQNEIIRDFYAELPNRIVVVGDFHDIARFVSDIASLSRIVTVEDITLAPVDGRAPGEDGARDLRMSATAKTYRYLDDEEVSRSSNRGRR